MHTMNLSWDVSGIPNHRTKCFYRAKPGELDNVQTAGESIPLEDGHGRHLMKLRPKVAALIWASAQVGLSHVSFENIEEWLYRLDALFDAGNAFMFMNTPEGRVPVRLNRRDLELYVGLRTSAKPIPHQLFDSIIRGLRMARQADALLDLTSHSDDDGLDV